MQFDIVSIALVILCLAGAVALVALTCLFVNLIKCIGTVMCKVDPLIDDTKELLDQAKPIVSRIDPMMERMTLTIDAANLEIMRVDQIMEDLGTLTGNLAKASNNIETAASAPLDVVSGIASKIRSFVSPATASENEVVSCAAQTVDGGLAGVEGAIAEKQANLAERKVAAANAAAERDEAQGQVNAGAANLKGGVLSHIDSDTE